MSDHRSSLSFSQACTVSRQTPGGFEWDVPEGWLQGRGVWGGLVIAAQVNAVADEQRRVDPTRRLRNVTSHLFGPLPSGPAQLTVAPLRVGSAMTTWQVQLVGSDGSLASQAVVIAGAPRAGDVAADWGTGRMPDLPAWQDVPAVPVEPPLGPEFGSNIVYRPVSGVPGSGGSSQAVGWVAPTDNGEKAEGTTEWTAATVLGIVDAWWPASYVAMTALRPMATVSFSAHLLVDPATLDGSAPLAFESWVSRVDEGFTSETRRLWSPEGELVVENHQAIVIVK